MDTLFTACAGLDVHKKFVVAALLVGPVNGPLQRQVRSFGTTTPELLELSDWLLEAGVSHVAMESTGPYWKPIYNLLEANFEIWLLNAQHVKHLPGRKTDIKDSEWIAELMRHGLLRRSFIPPIEQRDLRELVRERTNFVRMRATLHNRVQKVLESANIKLASVASDALGVSGRAMLEALLAGERDVEKLADLAKGKLREKREELKAALQGRLRPQHIFVLRQLLKEIDSLNETVAAFSEQIKAASVEDKEAIDIIESIPGVGRETAERVVAELGTDMSRFPTAGHCAAWAGLAPGQNESGGKKRPGSSRKGNTWLKSTLVQAAHGAAKQKNCYLAALYRRIAARRGSKRAAVAVARSILVIVYHALSRRERYQELGGDYFERQAPEARTRYLKRQLEKLGHIVTLESAVAV
jgi:transposase